MKVRSKDTFFDHISTKDEKTIDAYHLRINLFEKYCLEKFNTSDILEELQDNWEDILQSYINWLAKDRSPTTVSNYFISLRKYLHYLGVRITKDDVDESLNFPKKYEIERHPLQLEEIREIFANFTYKDKTLFMCQLSSGLRIGEIVQLRKKDFLLGNSRIVIKLPSKFAKFKRARTTVLSKDAGIMISGLLKQKQDNDRIFGTNGKSHYSVINKENILRRTLIKTGLNERYEETNHYKINTHSFRAYFITKFSRHDPNLAKKLAGEKGYLLQYDRLTDDEIIEQYLKVEPELTVYDYSIKESKISEKEQKQDETISKLSMQVEFLMAKQKLEESISNKKSI